MRFPLSSNTHRPAGPAGCAAALFLCCALVVGSGPGSAQADAASRAAPLPEPGPHPVGYRLLIRWDRSRSAGPRHDFEGHPVGGRPGIPLQVSVWYPAAPGADGPRLAVGDYRALTATRETLEPVTAEQRAGAAAGLRAVARIAAGVELDEGAAAALLATPMLARREPSPARGRFPAVLAITGSVVNGHLAEHLASHGYVVVSTASLPRTATDEAQRPQVALETFTRNLETLRALVRELPFADTLSVAVLGINFGGMAALNYQMRNMDAAAVVSLDGWEAKAGGAAILSASPYFDPRRLRVPYLVFSQDAPPDSRFTHDPAFLDRIPYAERRMLVVDGMTHAHLVDDLLAVSRGDERRLAGYAFVYSSLRRFLDAHLKGRAAPARPPAAPPGPVVFERRRPAAQAVPTPEELERLVMAGDPARVRAVLERARAADPAAQVFTPQEMRLYVFRFSRSGRPDVAVALAELVAEAYPGSAAAMSELGDLLWEGGNGARALAAFERALARAESDPTLDEKARAAFREALRRKIEELRPAGSVRPPACPRTSTPQP